MLTVPKIMTLSTSEVNWDDPIFGSLQYAYDNFEVWTNKVSIDSTRKAYVILNSQQEYAAVVITKPQEDDSYGFNMPVAKISTFKVSEHYAGRGYGTRLLETVTRDLRDLGAATTYIEVSPKHRKLISFLKDNSFIMTEHFNGHGDSILARFS